MSDLVEVTPGLQCCLRCGRTLTNRLLHDRLEEPIIDAIRSEHPEWVSADETCTPCVNAYRELLDGRLKRVERFVVGGERNRWWERVSRFLNRESISAMKLRPVAVAPNNLGEAVQR